MSEENQPESTKIKYEEITCQEQDVVDFKDNTHKVIKLTKAIQNFFNQDYGNNLNNYLRETHRIDVKTPKASQFFQEGIDCEILQLGSDKWKKAKVKIQINVAFYIEADEDKINSENINPPNSEIEDIRRQINKIIN